MSQLGKNTDTSLFRNTRRYGPEEGHYFLMDGEFLELPYRIQMLTRGELKANAATRIPLRLVNIDWPTIQRVLARLNDSSAGEISITRFLWELYRERGCCLELSDFEL